MKMFVVLLFGAVTLLGCGNEDGSDKGASEKTEQKSDNAAGKNITITEKTLNQKATLNMVPMMVHWYPLKIRPFMWS